MTDAWTRAKSLAEKHQGGIFVRLQNDGDKVVGAFVGDPHTREVLWTGEGFRAFDESNPAHAGKRPALRVLLNFWVPGDGMKIIEFGSRAFEAVLKCRAKYTLDSSLFEVERHGAKGDPGTKYTVLPDRPIDDAMRAQIRNAPLHDLAAVGGSDDEDVERVSQETAERFASILRALPRTAVDTFLREFSIDRIRDLRAAFAPRAETMLRALQSDYAAPAAEVDPFA